mmetsp:Transcript_30218/g.96529  ORF Transcript_30218/g.96529 Transcript_30218/m.96529 type:complete len:258 (+) Transcript_30218:363-1136(+)
MMARHVSRPMKSASVSGPIGTLVPSFMDVSIASTVPMPSYRVCTASLMYGIRIRFAMKPGMSRLCVQVLPIAVASARVSASVASLVASPGITSTSFITGTGFIKCMPITASGLAVAAAILVIEMEEVLEARMAPDGATLSMARNRSSFRPTFSVAASIKKLAPPKADMSVEVVMRASAAALSASVRRSFATSFASSLSIRPMHLSSCSCLTSTSTTLQPACTAATCAMPPPICPDPNTPTTGVPRVEQCRAALRRTD